MVEIYKKDSKGKIRVYKTHTIGDQLIQETGLMNGNLVRNETICKPKNVGKSSETTGEGQAKSEMNSRLAKKLKEGYFSTVREAQDEVVILPMLAKVYGEHKHKIVYPCYAQPKLDGMRASVDGNKMVSRKATPIETMDHILTQTSSIAGTILDGELYAHGVSFQDNMKLIKKYRPGSSETVKYHVYDCMMELPFWERYKHLCDVVKGLDNIEVVETTIIRSEEELKACHSKNIADGYEGTMVRWGEDHYKMDGRSDKLLKYKDFMDDVFKVIDIIPTERRPEQGMVVCKHGAHTFKATPKMSNADKEDLLKNRDQYIGQIAEIRYFELTDGGIPRFPVCVGFRLDK